MRTDTPLVRTERRDISCLLIGRGPDADRRRAIHLPSDGGGSLRHLFTVACNRVSYFAQTLNGLETKINVTQCVIG